MSLVCELQEDLTEQILKRVSNSLVCTEIDHLIVNLNNNSVFSILFGLNFSIKVLKWKADFDARSFGLLDVKDVRIFNASQIEGNIEAGAFNSSRRLSQFVIEESANNGEGQISSGSFSKLRYLQTVKLGV